MCESDGSEGGITRRAVSAGGCPRLVRWCGALALVAGLAGCGGGGGAADTPPVPVPPPVDVSTAALVPAQPGDLPKFFVDRIQRRVATGLDGTAYVPVDDFSSGPQFVFSASPQGSTGAIGGAPQQEAGVMEDDLLKSDGQRVYALHPQRQFGVTPTVPSLETFRLASDGSLVALSRNDLTTVAMTPGATHSGMHLMSSIRRLVVLSKGNAAASDAFPSTNFLYPYRPPVFGMGVFVLADSGVPVLAERIELDGTLVGTRVIGSTLYTVTTHAPNLSNYSVPVGSTPAKVSQTLANLTASALLPQVRVGNAPALPLVSESDCLLQPANQALNLQITTITAWDLSGFGVPARKSRCFIGGTEAIYMSAASVYLTSSRSYWFAGQATTALVAPEARTDIHKFALQAQSIDYRGSGDVAGHLGWDREKAPYRMSEFQGDLRVLTFTGQSGWVGLPGLVPPASSAPASPATLTVLRENAARRALDTLATLPNSARPAAIGHPGEQVYAVHFAGARGYLVTFRLTDPLYVLDLSNPADPKIAGELSVPGFSDYLFPLSNQKLLGVGKDADARGLMQGLKLSVFDVSNPAKPRLDGSYQIGERGSQYAMAFSRHAIAIREEGATARVAVPARLFENVRGGINPSRQGLLRVDIDTRTGALLPRPMVVSTVFDGGLADSQRMIEFNLAYERALISAGHSYYLSGGALTAQPWP